MNRRNGKEFGVSRAMASSIPSRRVRINDADFDQPGQPEPLIETWIACEIRSCSVQLAESISRLAQRDCASETCSKLAGASQRHADCSVLA